MVSLEEVWPHRRRCGLTRGGVASQEEVWPHGRRCGLSGGGVASQEEVRLSRGGTSLGVGLRV